MGEKDIMGTHCWLWEYLEKMKKGEKNLDEVVGMSVVSFMVDKHPNIVEDGGCFHQLYIILLQK
jgi:hypothetical protein